MPGRIIRRTVAAGVLVVAAGTIANSGLAAAAQSGTGGGGVAPNAYGGLDCNGLSPIQHPIRANLACADVHDASESDGRFEENDTYIGHDEPDLNFVSNAPGSGNNVSWTFKLGTDPAAPVTGTSPGNDVSHYFELTPAVWFSMNLCDPRSFPQTSCKPNSDTNAPRRDGRYSGGGSAFLELQFYPPGFGPWAVAPSFDNTHWGAALTIDSLEAAGPKFNHLNQNCTEPINFAFITHDGVPPGPPSPQLADLQSDTPNADTLLMNQGDTINVHIYDAAAPGGGNAVEAVVNDLSTGQSGFMQGSASNGFMNTNIANCKGYPYNFEPAYNTAAPGNLSPWGAGTEVISAAIETGHWEPCSSLSNPDQVGLAPGVTDTFYNTCSGPYESVADGDGAGTPEPSDAFCFPAGDTHGGLAAGSPDTATGCLDNAFQNGDLDFDGTPYWPEWPTGTTPGLYPSTFQFQPPTTNGQLYADYQYQTDAAFSEVSSCSPSTPSGCAVPVPGSPGGFYPYWSLQTSNSAPTCVWDFGNVSSGNTAGKDAQYGSIIAPNFPDLVGTFNPVSC
jgi:hypothetical protein